MNFPDHPELLRKAILGLPPEVRPLCDGLDHLGIAVLSLKETLPLYRDLLELPLLGLETIESDGVHVAIFDLKGAHLELLEPTSDTSPVAKFLKKHGPGLHHLALRVKDCAAAAKALREAGISMIDETPRRGASNKLIAFCHPRSTGGVLLELCERST